MKLESLKLGKFKENVLKKEQMFLLNAGGSPTGSGRVEGKHAGKDAIFDYAYDAIRTRSNGSTYLTFHGRSNITFLDNHQ